MTTTSLTMDMAITTMGVTYLKVTQQANQLAYFSGFRLGSSPAITIDPTLTNVGGSVSYFGSPAEMTFSRVNKHEVILRAVLDHTKGDFDIGSFAFLVGASQIPFMIGRLSYTHRKMADRPTQVGGRFTLQVKFKMYDMDRYWSFGNILESVAQADKTQTDVHNIPDSFVESPGYLMQVDTVLSTSNRKGYFLYQGLRGLSWRAGDLQMKNSDNNFWRLQGGSDGDGHNYTG